MKWLIDEMLPPAIAGELDALGYDALSASAAGLASTDDEALYAEAVAQGRVVVTENASDFAALVARRLANEQPCVPVVMVRKDDHRRGGGLAHRLARHLHRWATDNPDPYPGPHWP